VNSIRQAPLWGEQVFPNASLPTSWKPNSLPTFSGYHFPGCSYTCQLSSGCGMLCSDQSYFFQNPEDCTLQTTTALQCSLFQQFAFSKTQCSSPIDYYLSVLPFEYEFRFYGWNSSLGHVVVNCSVPLPPSGQPYLTSLTVNTYASFVPPMPPDYIDSLLPLSCTVDATYSDTPLRVWDTFKHYYYVHCDGVPLQINSLLFLCLLFYLLKID